MSRNVAKMMILLSGYRVSWSCVTDARISSFGWSSVSQDMVRSRRRINTGSFTSRAAAFEPPADEPSEKSRWIYPASTALPWDSASETACRSFISSAYRDAAVYPAASLCCIRSWIWPLRALSTLIVSCCLLGRSKPSSRMRAIRASRSSFKSTTADFSERGRSTSITWISRSWM